MPYSIVKVVQLRYRWIEGLVESDTRNLQVLLHGACFGSRYIRLYELVE
eukprot:SAG31_NODE_4220_length_3449_cov_1.831940_2_plen_49_part_00